MKNTQSYQPIRISKKEFEWVILVVEDDPVTSLMIQQMLTHNGYICKSVASGCEALEVLREIKSPVLILLDYSLPDMTGHELVKTLHANKIDIPFIVVTAHKQADIAVDMMKLGALDFITKDNDFLNLLIPFVKNALKKIQAERLLQIERKSTEKKLKEQNDFMVSILESISHPFYVINVDDFTIEIANSAARKNSAEKKISCYALAHGFGFPCEGPDHPCPIELIKKSGKPTVVEHTHLRNGKQKIFEVHAYPIFNSEGNLSKIIEHTNDITERRRMVMEIVEISQNERNEIGRDLHDSLGQQLTGISFLAGVLAQTLSDESRTETDLAAKISNLLTNAIEHTRAIARGLSPVEMEPDGFIIALEQLVDNFSRYYPVSIDFEKKGMTLFHDNRVATQLYYIAQEAINNSLKHSGADKIDFLANFQKETIYLEISDNGKGISRSSKKDRGLGLRIMEYRARLIGAILSIEKIKNGTKIICSLNI